MLILVGTVWPILGIPFSILSALAIPKDSWRWLALLLLPGLLFAVHYLFILPWCAANGNLAAAVVFALMIGAMLLYYPVIIVLAGLWAFRQISSRVGQAESN
ncbi:MAG: hypothetical protein LW850_27140 [Planctomycetaceae bacterium]|jgi:hypothetical protein|nr:hypothetical protein [Planctomycetaceae bacterium]